MKIYSDDSNLPYKTTEINYLRSKMDIDGLLGKWQIKDSAWHQDWEHNDVFIEFKYSEVIDGITVSPVIRVVAPLIWDHKKRNSEEKVNWNISMRVMYWFIKSHLEAAYLTQSSKTAAFLPYISTGESGQPLHRVIIHNLEKIQGLPALTEIPAPERGGS